jgi:hypothetical protein
VTVVEPSLLANYTFGPGDFARPGLLDPNLELGADLVHAVMTAHGVSWQAAIDSYYQAIHPWLSIVHYETFYGKLEPPMDKNDKRPPDVEMALLFLCMHVATMWVDSEHGGLLGMMRHPLYRAAKQALGLLRSDSEPSVELVQCGVLLALYEYGHGGPKKAYMTLGEAAAMGSVLGAKPGKFDLDDFDKPLDPDEEQMRALYWGVFIVDK